MPCRARSRIGTLALVLLVLGAPAFAGQRTASFKHSAGFWQLVADAWQALAELLPARAKSHENTPPTSPAPPAASSEDEFPDHPDRGGALDPIG
jgi:hypothetical protein